MAPFHQARSFPPIVATAPRALILGSMPGVRSLEAQQYYAHAQNSFWKIMAALFGAPSDDYAARIRIIEDNRLALWDVLQCCARAGSLDSAIDRETMQVNDFAAFFRKHPSLRHVFFNGGTAAGIFKKRVLPDLPEDVAARLGFTQLPSTSPAHAGMRFAEKLEKWRAVLAAVHAS